MKSGDIHPAAVKVLESYFRATDDALPGFLEGFYVYGSLSLGDFHPRKSDIDFVAATSRYSTSSEVRKLAALHRKLRWQFFRTDLNGLYVDSKSLESPAQKGSRFLCFQNGRVVSQHLHENNLITWHQLKTNALTLRGPASQDFPYEVSIKDLRAEMQQNLNTYWVNWMTLHRRLGLGKILLLTFPQKTEWGVLGVSRQWYTLETGQITSKTGAGAYCLRQFSDKYGDILETALAVRACRLAPIRNSFKRAAATLDYMEFIVRTFNQRYQEMYASQ